MDDRRDVHSTVVGGQHDSMTFAALITEAGER
jgi:hypothetical protein